MTTFRKPLNVWLLSVIVFCLILFVTGILGEPINDFWFIVLLTVFIVGIVSFLLIFIRRVRFQKPLQFITTILNRKPDKKILTILSILTILVLIFYWFQIRPSHIKASCQKEADEWRKSTFDRNAGKDGLVSFSVGRDIDQGTKEKYSFCLHRNGL